MRYSIFAILPIIFVLGCAGSLHLPEGTTVSDEDIPWSTTRGDCAQWAFGYCKSNGEPEILWKANLKTPILAPPAAGDGAIFVGTPTKRVFAFDALTGERIGKLWVNVPVEDGLSYSDGLLAITGRSIYNSLQLYDLDKNSSVWNKKSDRAAAAPIICGETIYYATAKGAIFAMNLSGNKLWRTALTDATIKHEPAFRDSLLFIADSNKKLYCLAADSGKIMWKITLPSAPVGPPIVLPDHVIIPTSSGRIPIARLDGNIRLIIEGSGELNTPIACAGPTIYGVTPFGVVFAGDIGEGGLYWETNLDEPVIVPPTIWGTELVVITASNRLALLDLADGRIVHEIDIGEPVSAAPIVYISNLYIGTETGELIAVGRKSETQEIQNDRQ